MQHKTLMIVALLLALTLSPAVASAQELPDEAVRELIVADRFVNGTPAPRLFGAEICFGGNLDQFAEPFDEATQTETLIDRCVEVSSAYDRPSTDGTCFGDVFEDCWPPGCRVTRATLNTRVRGVRSLASNDTISLIDPHTGDTVWGSRIADLAPGWGNGVTETLIVPLPQEALDKLSGGETAFVVQDDTVVDFAILRVWFDCRARVCGHKFHDRDCDGQRDRGEAPIEGWKIVAEGAEGLFSAVTDETGNYCLDLPPGSYTVGELARTGWVQTAPAHPGAHQIEVGSGEQVDGLDFGNRRCHRCRKKWGR